MGLELVSSGPKSSTFAGSGVPKTLRHGNDGHPTENATKSIWNAALLRFELGTDVIRFGLIKVCLWSNSTKAGERVSVTAVRLFKDGDRWRESTRFGRDDLPLLAKAIDLAHTWIYEQRTNSKETRATSTEPAPTSEA